jgi:hypothetical protein
MERLNIPSSQLSPEICLDPDTWSLSIKGVSAPEDVRNLYYPVIRWIREMTETVLANPAITGEAGVRLTVDLQYFNSSSAKFLHDIFIELARLKVGGSSIEIRWLYDEEDIDMLEAGEDMAALSGIEFLCLPK